MQTESSVRCCRLRRMDSLKHVVIRLPLGGALLGPHCPACQAVELVLLHLSTLLFPPTNPAGEGSRLFQVVEWFGPSYDGLIVLDECHRAKNCLPK